MQSSLPYAKILVYIFALFFLISSCRKKNDLENQITIKINSIDRETKQPRVNTFDTIEVRIVKFGFLGKRFVKEAEYTTDSTGSVKIKIDRDEGYMFLLSRRNYYGSETFDEAFTKKS